VQAANFAPVSASGTITAITPGDVSAAGVSGKWVVHERQITGELSGDISGPFIMDYRANVELATQAGNLEGKLTVGSYVLNVNGNIAPLEMVPTPFGFALPMLSISGRWNIVGGTPGSGTFEAWLIFIPTEDGHVGYILFSSFNLTGKWK
jgi:hypothetical protein